MIYYARRYVSPLLRTWTFLSQSWLWLKRPSEFVTKPNHGALPSQTAATDQQVRASRKQEQWLDALDKQPLEVHLRSLMVLCQGLTRQYQSTPEVVLERWWWYALHRAGVRLRDRLEEISAYQKSLHLTTQELEQAYLLLIHVAYFFEPGGVAETICQEQGWILDRQYFERF